MNQIEETARAISEAEFGPNILISELEGGQINTVFRIDASSSGTFVIRLNERDDPDQDFISEQAKIEWAGEHGIKVPTVISNGVKGEFAYLIEEFIGGTSGDVLPIPVNDLWKQIGSVAQKINGIETRGFGTAVSNRTTKQFSMSWIDYQKDTTQEGFELISKLDLYNSKKVAYVYDSFMDLKNDDWNMGLILLNIGPPHCIFQPDGDIYVIDWEMGESGLVPEMQLAWISNWWGMNSEKYQSFRAGYFQDSIKERENHTLIRLFSAVFSIDSLRWAYQRKSRLLDDYIESADYHLNEFSESASAIPTNGEIS